MEEGSIELREAGDDIGDESFCRMFFEEGNLRLK